MIYSRLHLCGNKNEIVGLRLFPLHRVTKFEPIFPRCAKKRMPTRFTSLEGTAVRHSFINIKIFALDFRKALNTGLVALDFRKALNIGLVALDFRKALNISLVVLC